MTVGRCEGCSSTRPRVACDTDHLVPWPDGPTTLPNAVMLCRYHHRLKTHAASWDIEGSGDDDVMWTTPSGRRSCTRPAAHAVGPTPPTDSDPAAPEDDPTPF